LQEITSGNIGKSLTFFIAGEPIQSAVVQSVLSDGGLLMLIPEGWETARNMQRRISAAQLKLQLVSSDILTLQK
jgi:hypothetical protein